jgi:uncharacterized protein (TIGR02594 family)
MNFIVKTAQKYLGVTEVKGPKHHPIIAGWLTKLGAWYRDDESPWCGTFCAAIMKECGYSYPKLFMRALEWAKWGYPCPKPIEGCIAVKTRKGGGHVTIVVGRHTDGSLLCLGGNQGDKVSIAKYREDEFIAFRYPMHPKYAPLPVMTIAALSNVGEA